MLLGVIVMGAALATRAQIDLAVQHDRAPLFVQVRDGSIRNGYTLKISNKTQAPAEFVLTMRGLNGGVMALADQSGAPAPTLVLPVDADSIGTFRLLVFGRPDARGGRLAEDGLRAAQRDHRRTDHLHLGVHGARQRRKLTTTGERDTMNRRYPMHPRGVAAAHPPGASFRGMSAARWGSSWW